MALSTSLAHLVRQEARSAATTSRPICQCTVSVTKYPSVETRRESPVVSMPAPSGPRLATWNLIRSLHIGHRRFPLSDQSRVGTCYGMLGGRLGPNHDVASKISQGETPSSRNLMLLAHTGACQVEIVGTLLVARSGAARTRSISVVNLRPSPKTGTTPFESRFVLTHTITRRGHAHLNPVGRLIPRSLLKRQHLVCNQQATPRTLLSPERSPKH
jgi:hypothetical protein